MLKQLLRIIAPLLLLAIYQTSSAEINSGIHNLEQSTGGRLGIAAVNTENGKHFEYRTNERFPMGCTSKVMGVAAILKMSMQDKNLLNERIKYTEKDLETWAPITKKHLTTGMTVTELCAAAISYSDNTAMNLLTKKLGGPQGINNFARAIGDQSYKLDHWWPDEAFSGPDNKDSSTPGSMTKSLQKLALGDALASTQRSLLLTWMKANTTGDARIRAGVPTGWLVADKTGTGAIYGTTNDIAVVWPPNHSPIVLTIFYTNLDKKAPKRDDIVAKATVLVLQELLK